MSLRGPSSHILANSDASIAFVLKRGGRISVHEVSPAMATLCGVGGGLLLAWFLMATLYLVFKDEVLARFFSQQTELQYAYEDRIATLRTHIDRITSRQMLNQDSFDAKIDDLLARQAKLETRQAVVSALAEQAAPLLGKTSLAGARPVPPALMDAFTPVSTGSISSFATMELRGKPQPVDGDGKRPPPSAVGGPAPGEQKGAAPLRSSALPAANAVDRVRSGLDSIERGQVAALSTMERLAQNNLLGWKSVLNDVGLGNRFTTAAATPAPSAGKANAIGGPFVPLPGAGPFEARVNEVQGVLLQAEKLRKVMQSIPLQRPMPGDHEITSGYGSRLDPFLRQHAMHTGIDFRAPQGTGVRVTAPGKVVEAGWNGGYGNMVEVDHGNGMTTRYAHLSQISVSEGQTLAKGDVVGRVGNTGRSTGAHLHYEVRVDGDATDPMRFLKAGQRQAMN